MKNSKQLAIQKDTLAPRTCKLILNANEPRKLIKHTASLTVATALEGEQLSKLSRENEEEIENVMIAIIANFNNSVNVGNKLTPDQIYEIALSIISDYWMLKIDEILNCFKMAKGGKYGEIKRLDQPTIMGFLHQYDTKTKAEYFNTKTVPMQRREREEENEPKAILLSVEDIKALKLKDNTNK